MLYKYIKNTCTVLYTRYFKKFYESFEDTQGCYQKRNLKNDRKNI